MSLWSICDQDPTLSGVEFPSEDLLDELGAFEGAARSSLRTALETFAIEMECVAAEYGIDYLMLRQLYQGCSLVDFGARESMRKETYVLFRSLRRTA